MGRRTQTVEATRAPTPTAPEAPAPVPVPVPVPVPAAAAAPAPAPVVPVRKSIRILTRNDDPETTPSQQAPDTTPTTQALPLAPYSTTRSNRTRTTRQLAKNAPTTHLDETKKNVIDLGRQHRDHYEFSDELFAHGINGATDDELSSELSTTKQILQRHHKKQPQKKRAPPSLETRSAKRRKHTRVISASPLFEFGQPDLNHTVDEMIVERRIKLVTEQHNIPKPPQMEGYPMKEWTVEVYILDEAGKEKPARCFQKVVYNLHPSFDNPIQTFHEPPFKCTNEGWGEFEMTIDCYTTEKGGKQSILHDLNFAQPTYENIHTIQFKNPSQALQAVLRETGPLPTDEDRKARKNLDGAVGGVAAKKKKTYDLEKMADAIPRLNEDDLLHVIQLIHDNKNDDTYIMNNPDAGEFSIDLYTMPDNLCRLMWEFLLTTPEGHRLR